MNGAENADGHQRSNGPFVIFLEVLEPEQRPVNAVVVVLRKQCGPALSYMPGLNCSEILLGNGNQYQFKVHSGGHSGVSNEGSVATQSEKE